MINVQGGAKKLVLPSLSADAPRGELPRLAVMTDLQPWRAKSLGFQPWVAFTAQLHLVDACFADAALHLLTNALPLMPCVYYVTSPVGCILLSL